MASFSTIPEETPLLDAERPKQRKFAATTVAVLRRAEDNFEGNLCLAATGSVNEDVIETAICDGDDKYQAWQLKVIEELPQHLDDEYGGH